MKSRNLLLTFATLLMASMALAAVPQLISLQGVLKDSGGNPVTDGSYSVVFTVYDAPSGGTVLWAETTSVSTTGGLFTALLGSVNPVPESLFFDPSRWLGITVGADPEMTPRQQLSTVGYSFVSSQWTSAAENLFRLNGRVGIGTANPSVLFDVVGTPTVFGSPTDSGDVRSLISVEDLSPADLGVGAGIRFGGKYNSAGGTSIFAGIKGIKENSIDGDNAGALVFSVICNSCFPFERMRISSEGNVGIGTTSPSQKLDVAGTAQMSGFKMPTGAANSFVLTSDASGVGTWQAASGGASGWADDGAVVRLFTGTDAVGIGTAAPTKKLDVAGSIKVGANDTVFSSILSSNSPLSLQAPAGATRLYIDDVTGNVGIGTNTPSNKLEVAGMISGTDLAISSGTVSLPANQIDQSEVSFNYAGSSSKGGSATDLACANCVTLGSETSGDYDATPDVIADDGVISDGEASDVLTINNGLLFAPTSGSVGIGNTLPTKKLEVTGSVKVSDTLFVSNLSSNSPLNLQTAGTTRMYIDDATGNVGIGTTTPSDRLTVAGNLKIGAGQTTSIYHNGVQPFIYSTTGPLWVGDATNQGMWVGTGNFVVLNGNTGLGTYTPGERLDIIGNVRATNGWFSASYNNTHGFRWGNSSTGPNIHLRPFIMSFNGDGANGNFGFYTTASDADAAAKLYINTSGNVGIGTTTPTVKLDIVGGNVNLENSSATVGSILKSGQRFIHNFGTANTFVGIGAGNLTLTGVNNTANGTDALASNTTGNFNTAIGRSALPQNTSGYFNTGIGGFSLFSNNTGYGNTAVGYDALHSSSSGGIYNTAIGSNALTSNLTGDYITAIGVGANVSNSNLENATAIGANATVDASNKIRLGNTAVTVIEGQVAYTFPSDKNQKENFQSVDGEEVLRKLRKFNLTSWNYKGHDPKQFRHYGPMAQDFFAAFGNDSVGIIGTPTTLNSGDVAGILMIAVQTLEIRTAEIAELKKQVCKMGELKAQLSNLQELVQKLLADKAKGDDGYSLNSAR